MSALPFTINADGEACLRPDLTEAQRLLECGFNLVKLHDNTKQPVGLEWNKHAATAIDPAATGYGMPLVANGLCSIDPDHLEMARAGLKAWGFDLDELLTAGVRTESTRPGSGGRSAFTADEMEMTRWLTFNVFDEQGKGTTVLELRAKSENLQDCVPGLVYVDKRTGQLCTQRYAAEATFDDAPALPDAFARLWRLLSTDDEALREHTRLFCEAIATAGHKVNGFRPQHRPPMGSGKKLAFPAPCRGDFNRESKVEDILERHGYKWHAREGRWSHPGATGAAGIRPIPGKDDLWQSDHAGDALHGTFDAWGACVQLDHLGSVEAATEAYSKAKGDAALDAVDTPEAVARDTESVQTLGAVDLFGNMQPPAFPVDLLPTVVAAYARDQAELIGVDPAVIGMAAIGAMAGCIDDRLTIQPKRYDPTWTESARLWVGIIGDPSAKKSPGISKALGPVRKIAAKWRADYEKAKAQWQEECDALTKENKKAMLPPGPELKRLTASDVTVEKLGDILSRCEPRGILIDRDEMTGWLASMDAYKAGSGGKDKAAWLEAYNGGGMEIDRISRGSLWVENWSACVVGGIQPQVIQDYANTTNHDGMLQRFMLIHAAPAKQGKDRYPNMDAKNAYTSLLEHLVALKGGEHDAVQLSEKAHEIREEFNAKLHKAVCSMPNKHLTAMLGKWEGLFARMLLVFHAAECSEWMVHPVERKVDEETARRVSELLWRVMLPHAIKFYDGLDPTDTSARNLAGLLLARGWERFTTKRDLNNNMLAYRKMKEWEREEMLDRLEAYGWIWPEPGGRMNERGKPAAYCVNKTIHQRFKAHAEIERERRAAVAETMADLRN